MGRILAMLYSITAYAIGVGALVYLILFIADWPFIPDSLVPVTINQGFADTQLGLMPMIAAIWNGALIVLWGYQHTLMASLGFKERWAGVVPPSVERSTYVLFVALFTAILVILWQPLPLMLWDVSGTALGNALNITYVLGWVIVLFSTFLINHFHLFGLQQAFVNLAERETKQASFTTPMLYKLCRHPMMLGVVISLWSIPTLTVGRLVIAVGMTIYVWIGVRYEEKTLIAELGDEYREYQKTTPSVIPFTKP